MRWTIITTTIDRWLGYCDFTRKLDKSCRLVLNLGGKWIHVSPLGVDVAETSQVKGIKFQNKIGCYCRVPLFWTSTNCCI